MANSEQEIRNILEQCACQVRELLQVWNLKFKEKTYAGNGLTIFQMGSLRVETLGFEEESQEDGDIFVNQPFYDSLFGAMGARRIGKVNLKDSNFSEQFRKLLLQGGVEI